MSEHSIFQDPIEIRSGNGEIIAWLNRFSIEHNLSLSGAIEINERILDEWQLKYILRKLKYWRNKLDKEKQNHSEKENGKIKR